MVVYFKIDYCYRSTNVSKKIIHCQKKKEKKKRHTNYVIISIAIQTLKVLIDQDARLKVLTFCVVI